MATKNITSSTFDADVLKSNVPVLVDFWATWCNPCKMAEPVLEELSEVYAGKVGIVKVDVDENGPLAEKYGVMSIPTTVMFKNGEEVGRQTGFAGKTAYEELIKKTI